MISDINKLRVGFIGAGKVGFSLGKYFTENKVEVTGYVSKNYKSAEAAAKFTGSKAFVDLKDLVLDSDIIFITVPDQVIQLAWESIKPFSLSGKIICHCSGSLSSEVFVGIELLGAYACSTHPLLAISDKYSSFSQLTGALFTIEGSPGCLRAVELFFNKLGNKVQVIESEFKPQYHAAAVMASNQMIALAQLSIELLTQCGFTDKDALSVLGPLMKGNIDNIISQGTTRALTGPVERNDNETIQRHLTSLSSVHLRVYKELTGVLLHLAKNKHPDKDYIKIAKELE